MKIDCHIHAFTDSIAERAISKLSSLANIKNYTDGTENDSREKLAQCGVDYGVILPIATKASQQTTINNWAAEVNKGNFICFGTVHPDSDNLVQELERIKKLGLKGVKLHPDFQEVFLFEERLIPFWQKCAELDLPVSVHMGYDASSPFVHHAMPQDLLYVHSRVPDVNIIAAHMGGMFAWEAVLHYVCGDRKIWLDTAFCQGYLKKELMESIIRKHGADRILFASDMPWHLPSMEIQLIESLDISPEDKERIFWKNANELLYLGL